MKTSHETNYPGHGTLSKGVGRSSRRIVEHELLDELPPDDPRAIHSRRDLQRLNRIMGHAEILASILRSQALRRTLRLLELGAGDGTFLLRLAQRMHPLWNHVEATLVDRQDLVTQPTLDRFALLGWQVKLVQEDVLAWLDTAPGPEWNVVLANLFLHHFPDPDLSRLLQGCAGRAHLVVACEPRRGPFSLCAAHGVRLIGCDAITRHDAIVSVRAGFRDQELSEIWPGEGSRWELRERAAGLFSHSFSARRLPAQ